jgi:hypothetical protein
MTVTEIQYATHGCKQPQVMCHVLVPAHLSATGKARWADKPIDPCLAEAVNALNKLGCLTTACCCAHGKGPGRIILRDGTRIITPRCEKVNGH